MPELLLELMSEEIPAHVQRKASADLERLITAGLEAAGLPPSEARSYSTPRRLCLVVKGLPEMTPAAREERRGPRVDAPKRAIEGFLRSTGLDIEALEIRDDRRRGAKKKGESVKTYYAVFERPGTAVTEIVPGIVQSVMKDFPWPKSMRWGHGSFRWIRPLRSILCILSDGNRDQDGSGGRESDVVRFSVAGIRSGNRTFGHRFMFPAEISVSSFGDYRDKLRTARVVLDPDERRAMICRDAEQIVHDMGWQLVHDPGLLAEISGLVEWPVVLAGAIDPEFLELPPEVLQVSMREHQKFLSARNPDNGRIEGFITVANTETKDGGAKVLEGNRRVLSARLSDAKFFWEHDLRQARDGMTSWNEDLERVTYFADLGTQADRVTRLVRLAGELSCVTGADPEKAEAAARVAKADLLSSMVQEFPELQGTMGRHYAVAAGFDGDVARACEEHYAPKGPDDRVPAAPVSVTLALADRLDTLTGFWRIGEKPTGSRDPYGLRRAALGVIRLILDNGLRLPLLKLFESRLPPDISDNLLGFIHDRLKGHLRELGVTGDLVDACLELPGRDDLALLVRRVRSLAEFLDTDDGENLVQGFRRAKNILVAEERKDGVSYELAPDPALAREEAERLLFSALGTAETAVVTALENEDFVLSMTEMSKLRAPVDAYFDTVLVNVDNSLLRRNRLCLMNRICEVMCRAADFSRLGV